VIIVILTDKKHACSMAKKVTLPRRAWKFSLPSEASMELKNSKVGLAGGGVSYHNGRCRVEFLNWQRMEG
jgi:hypothetical protein